jgi:hypothetical protein
VLSRKVGNALTSLAHRMLEKMRAEHAEEELEVVKRNLKDLKFETCSRADLEEFFRDKSFKKEIVEMLRIYVEIRCVCRAYAAHVHVRCGGDAGATLQAS